MDVSYYLRVKVSRDIGLRLTIQLPFIDPCLWVELSCSRQGLELTKIKDGSIPVAIEQGDNYYEKWEQAIAKEKPNRSLVKLLENKELIDSIYKAWKDIHFGQFVEGIWSKYTYEVTKHNDGSKRAYMEATCDGRKYRMLLEDWKQSPYIARVKVIIGGDEIELPIEEGKDIRGILEENAKKCRGYWIFLEKREALLHQFWQAFTEDLI